VCLRRIQTVSQETIGEVPKQRKTKSIDELYCPDFFGGGGGLNPELCIYYTMSLATELSSRWCIDLIFKIKQDSLDKFKEKKSHKRTIKIL
jgi:hypothetical protein